MELTIENLIKIILGVLVVGLVVFGIYTFFRNHFIEFSRAGNETVGVFFALIS